MKLQKPMMCAALLALSASFTACDDETTLDEATLRSLRHQQELVEELTEQPYGWKVTYFPNTDSLLFSDLNRKIGPYDYDPVDMGYGGYFYTMEFSKEGSVKMRSDKNRLTYTRPQTSEYQVKQGMMTQLSFTTYNYIHELVNGQLMGSSDFFYKGKNIDHLPIYTTGKYIEPAREYVLFEPIAHAEDTLLLEKAQANRRFFEDMSNPQLSIRQGDRVFFESNYPVKSAERAEAMRNRRYAVFLFEKVKNPTGDFPKEANALGSGYVGTDTGLTFYPGLRLNSKYIFNDFERVGDKFVCELVRVFSVEYKRYYYSTKHRHPEGEFTGMRAEIYNVPKD